MHKIKKSFSSAVVVVPAAPHRRLSSRCAGTRSSRRRHRWRFLRPWRRDAAERRAGCFSLSLSDPADLSAHANTHTHTPRTFKSVFCEFKKLFHLCMHLIKYASVHILHILQYIQSSLMTLWDELLWPWGVSGSESSALSCSLAATISPFIRRS